MGAWILEGRKKSTMTNVLTGLQYEDVYGQKETQYNLHKTRVRNDEQLESAQRMTSIFRASLMPLILMLFKLNPSLTHQS